MEDTKEFIRRFRALRRERGESQRQIAQVLGTSQTMYARYERGVTQMPLRHLVALSDHYGISADYLLGLTDQRKRH